MHLLAKPRISLTSKICLSGLLIALDVILQKVVAINYIAVVPFLRLSLGGPAIVIFASIFLGPWFGLLIGAAGDLLGYLIFDPKTMGFFPQITAIYALLGLLAYFIFALIKHLKNNALAYSLLGLTILAGLTFVTLYLCLNNELQLYSSTYEVTPLMRILVPSLMGVFAIAMFIFAILLDKKKGKTNNSLFSYPQLALGLLIIEVIVMVMFGTLMKGLAFGFATYPVILITQIITLFFNVPLNTFLISMLLRITRKYYAFDTSLESEQ